MVHFKFHEGGGCGHVFPRRKQGRGTITLSLAPRAEVLRGNGCTRETSKAIESSLWRQRVCEVGPRPTPADREGTGVEGQEFKFQIDGRTLRIRPLARGPP